MSSMTGALAAIHVEDLPGDEGSRFEVEHGLHDVGYFAHSSDRGQSSGSSTAPMLSLSVRILGSQ